jgi:hypothetical protein
MTNTRNVYEIVFRQPERKRPCVIFRDGCWIILNVEVLGSHSRRGLGIFLFNTVSKTALGHTQPPIQWVMRPGREADHSPPSGIPPLPQHVFIAWLLVKKSGMRMWNEFLWLSIGSIGSLL